MLKKNGSLEAEGRLAALGQHVNTLKHAKMALSGLRQRRQISQKEYEKRVEGILFMQQRLANLSLLLREKQKVRKEIHDLGLPDTSLLTPRQCQMLEESLDGRLFVLKQTYKHAKKLRRWAIEASEGAGGWFRGTARLAKFKRMTAQLASEESLLDKNMENQNKFINKLGDKIGPSPKQPGTNHIKLLMHLFSHIHNISSRIATLMAKVQQERQRASQLSSWVQHKEPIKRHQPPTLTAIKKAEALSCGPHLNPLEYAKSRLVMARKFLAECQKAMEERGSHWT